MKYKTYYEQAGSDDGQRNQRVNAEQRVQRNAGESSEHDKLAVRQVQHPGNTILQTESHSDQGIDATDQQTTKHHR